MTFARIRPIGMWTFASVIDGGELELIDQNLSRAVDGFAGGSYAPTSKIIIGGQGLEVTGFAAFSGGTAFVLNPVALSDGATLSVDNAVTTLKNNAGLALNVTSGGIQVAGTGTFLNDLTVGGAFGVTGASLFNGGIICKDVFLQSGNLTVDVGAAIFNGSATFNGAVGFNDPVIFGNTVIVGEELALAGAGRIRKRAAHVADTNMTLSVLTADYYVERVANTITAPRTFTLSRDGAEEGSEIMLHLNHATHDVEVVDAGNGSVGNTPAGASLSHFLFQGGRWFRMALHDAVDV